MLRPATPADAEALSRLATDSFVAAFGSLYKLEDLRAFLEEYRSVERYRADLADPAKRVQLAGVDGNPAAYCLIVLGQGFDERPEPRPARPVYLSQLYCAPGMAGHGLGAALMDWAIAEARSWGADALQLSVFSENHGAQRFYQRYGFRHVADIDFWVGGQRDDEFLYELVLSPQAGGE
jgi:GNAT superfamily N-acetyltransferase